MADNNKNNKNNKNSNRLRGVLTLVLWAVVLTVAMNYISAYSGNTANKTSSHEIKYSQMIDMVEKDQVDEILFKDSTIYITPVEGYTYTEEAKENSTEKPKSYTQSKDAKLTLYTAQLSDSQLLSLLEEHNVAYTGYYKAEMNPVLVFMASYVLPIIIMVGLFMLVMRFLSKSGGGGFGGIGSVGKSNAKVYMEKSTGVTFKDVAGQDEAKESLEEIIDFLYNPGRYTAIGAKLPKGALLVGSPGTGKTLLAKAVAGEAGVPFFSISGSGFVEMFVGVGASRVRDLFKEAAKVAPCIIFIDEIDAIGKTRDSRFGGGNDEREQTLNQLLAEMDGFDPSKGIIVLAATNRPEVLDKALLRPGRFDRRITVDRPNLAGRLATLQVHTRTIKLAEDVDLEKIAQATAGCVGADLANLVNEAALRAVRKGRRAVNQNDLLVSFELVIAGSEGHRHHRAGKAHHRLSRGGPCPGGGQAEERPAGQQDHHRAPYPGRAGLYAASAGGGEVPHVQGGHPGRDPHPAGGPLQRGGRVQHHDLRRRQRYRAGHGDGTESGGPVRHVRGVRHDGPGHRAESVSGRLLLHVLRPGDLRRR